MRSERHPGLRRRAMAGRGLMLSALFLACTVAPPLAPAPAEAAAFSCPSCDLRNKDFTGIDLTDANLTGANLSGVVLSGLTMNGAKLASANLTGAKLEGAKLNKSAKGPADLRSATLTHASFKNAQLDDALFDFATLNCADLSSTDLSTAQFGPRISLESNLTTCRTKFQNSTMGCEFIGQWKALDLSNADVSACLASLGGVDFSGAVMPGVKLTSGDPNKATDLSMTVWSGANLTGASFTSGILTSADFSTTSGTDPTILSGADLTFVRAMGAKFDWANLNAVQSQDNPLQGARLNFSYLGNATFKHAQLSFADLSDTILTGTDNEALEFATLDGAKFKRANLSGLDLSKVKSALGVDFSNANLSNSNLKDLDMGPNTFDACGTRTTIVSDLVGAFLCGATLDTTTLNCANLTAVIALPPDEDAGSGQQCAAAVRTNVKTNGVPPAGLGCFTTCPDGSPGACEADARWQNGALPPKPPCCTATPGGPPCPPKKRTGFACTTDCDCVSESCVQQKCT